MRKLSVFNFISLDGYYKDINNGIAWHNHDEEGAEYSAQSLQAGNILLFGRVTYDMMASFWPSPMAAESLPVVAEGMNKAEKIVFSRTMKKADWNNSRVISSDIVEEMKKLKQTPGKDMTILGSGTILTQFASAGIIDDYQIMLDPTAIGSGTSVFRGISHQLNLKLINIKTFRSGTLLLSYQPI
jgi:dihydrofolate reductase